MTGRTAEYEPRSDCFMKWGKCEKNENLSYMIDSEHD